MAGGRVVWTRIEDFGDPVEERPFRAYCQAPRHDLQFIPSAYVMCLIEDGQDPLFQGMCSECMEHIAADLHTTAAAGALVLR